MALTKIPCQASLQHRGSRASSNLIIKPPALPAQGLMLLRPRRPSMKYSLILAQRSTRPSSSMGWTPPDRPHKPGLSKSMHGSREGLGYFFLGWHGLWAPASPGLSPG